MHNMEIMSDTDFKSLKLRDALGVLTGYCSAFFPKYKVSFSTSGWMSPSIASLGYRGVVFYMDPRRIGITATLVVLAHELGHIDANMKGIMTGPSGEIDAFEQGARFADSFGVMVEYIGYIKYLAAKYSRVEHSKTLTRIVIPPDAMESIADKLTQQYNIPDAELWILPASVDVTLAKWDAEYRRRMM